MNQRPDRSRRFDPVRAAAVEALVAIEQGDQIDAVINSHLQTQRFRPIDTRFFLQLVNGATKMRRRLDYEIKFYLTRPSVALPIKLQNILRLGFYQILFTDRVPDAAAVSESVNLARRFLDPSQAKLVNAVLRSKLREPEKVVFVATETDPLASLGNRYSYPDYFVKYCLEEFGPERAEALLATYNESPRQTYRVNRLKYRADDITRALADANIPYHPGEYLEDFFHLEVGGLPLEGDLIQTGKVFVQDESAGLAVRLLNPKPGMQVIDLTAAPGGKATYAAIRMRNEGHVLALDKSAKRLAVVEQNARRQGITILAPVVADMLDFDGGQFDRVLLDPPCSGWGTAGKNADLRWAKTQQDLDNLARIQTRMIDKAARLVKPGGVLVYSTCTIIRQENDQIVEEFLLRNKQFEIDPADQFFDKRLVSERGYVKTYPDHPSLHGAFAARLRRRQRSGPPGRKTARPQ